MSTVDDANTTAGPTYALTYHHPAWAEDEPDLTVWEVPDIDPADTADGATYNERLGPEQVAEAQQWAATLIEEYTEHLVRGWCQDGDCWMPVLATRRYRLALHMSIGGTIEHYPASGAQAKYDFERVTGNPPDAVLVVVNPKYGPGLQRRVPARSVAYADLYTDITEPDPAEPSTVDQP